MKKSKRPTHKLPMSGGVKKGFRAYVCAVLVIAVMTCFAVPVFAAGNDPVQVVNNLSDFIFGKIIFTHQERVYTIIGMSHNVI